MERSKTPKLVITFPNTTAAMAMDAVCNSQLGRLISVPGEISAGCGLAWCALPEQADDIMQVIEDHQLLYQDKHIVLLY